MNKELIRNTIIPRQWRFGENLNWEETLEYFKLDDEIMDSLYFENMDTDKFIRLTRHMDNVMMEHGLSYTFIRNYSKVCAEFEKIDERNE